MKRHELRALFRLYDPDEHFITLDEVKNAVQDSHPDWTAAHLLAEAEALYRVILGLESDWYHSQSRFQPHVFLCENPHEKALGIDYDPELDS